jgi:hypothetical protein
MLQREYRTACGGRIVVPPKTADHLRAHPEVVEHLGDAIARVRLPDGGAFLRVAVEMNQLVGRSGCVQTPLIGLQDKSLFAQRIGRERPSRVVIGEGEETTKFVVLAFPARGETGTYVLVTSWVGSLAFKEPWDSMIKTQEEYQESLGFWCSNALVWDADVMSAPFESTWEEILGE